MTISIIIPTFNVSNTLENTLLSIENQTYKNVEVVIIDGLSTDETLSIAKKYQKSGMRIKIQSEADVGIYDAMNKGLDIASGDWLFFLGSDDTLFEKNTLEKIEKVLNDTQSEIVYGNVKIIGDTGWARDGDVYDGEFTIQKLLNQNICHQAIFYNTQFIKKQIGYYNLKYKKSADWDFNLKCWSKGQFKYVDIIVANFAAGGFSTNSNDVIIVNDMVDNIVNYFDINLFHKLINTPKYIFYNDVVKKQQEKHYFRHKFLNIKNRIVKRIIRK